MQPPATLQIPLQTPLQTTQQTTQQTLQQTLQTTPQQPNSDDQDPAGVFSPTAAFATFLRRSVCDR